jgi:hypothetical protein
VQLLMSTTREAYEPPMTRDTVSFSRSSMRLIGETLAQ